MIRVAQEARLRADFLITQSRALTARARLTGKLKAALASGTPEAQRIIERERAATEAALAAEHASLALAELDAERREAEDRAWFRAEALRMLADGWTREELREIGFTGDFLRWGRGLRGRLSAAVPASASPAVPYPSPHSRLYTMSLPDPRRALVAAMAMGAWLAAAPASAQQTPPAPPTAARDTLPKPPAGGVAQDILSPPDEGTYELSAVEEFPALRNREAVTREIERLSPPSLPGGDLEGDVVVRFRILANGTVDPASPVAERSTHDILAEPALAVVRRMRFRPAQVAGRAVTVWVTIPIHFAYPEPKAPADSAAAPPAP